MVLGTLIAIAVFLLVVAVFSAAMWVRMGRQPGAAAAAQQQMAMMEQLASFRRDIEQQGSQSRQEQQQRLDALREQVSQRLTELNTQLNSQLTENRRQSGETTRQLFQRLEASGKQFTQIAQQFGELRESSKTLAALGADIAKLQGILVPSSRRGAFGEEQLEELLRNVLPAGSYQMQYAFKDGQKVDAIVHLAHGRVCIDSKFPRPAFDQFLAADGPEQRKAAFTQFTRDCRKHVDDIAAKYIRPDEGTLDFALMWIPAENIYYHTIMLEPELGQKDSIAQYGRQKRVICVSPNTLMAYLNVILIGLKGLQIEQNAKQILAGLSRVGDTLSQFGEDFRVVGRHLDNARNKYADAEKQLTAVQEQVGQLGARPGTEPTDEGPHIIVAASDPGAITPRPPAPGSPPEAPSEVAAESKTNP